MRKTIALVTPVLDDWESFVAMLTDICRGLRSRDVALQVYAVDDGSISPFEPASVALPSDSCITSIEVICLAVNLGHQRAIAVGLCAVAADDAAEAVLVMDSDGQDRPADIPALLAASALHPQHAVVAARTRRAEPFGFRLWYQLYRLIFRTLTGQSINFGNYCLLPMAAVRRLVHMPELWNNLATSIMRSRLPCTRVPTTRGRRISGRSRMNLLALFIHGFSAMSVYSDVIFIRVLLAAGGAALIAVLSIIAVSVMGLVTNLAIPRWAITTVGDLLIILLQTVIIAIAASLTKLAGRSNRPMVPLVDCAAFIAGRSTARRIPSRPVLAVARPVA